MSLEEQEKAILARLKEERESRKLSQLDLAYISGVSQNMITYIENGKRTPSLRTVLKLCDALQINPSVLFAESNEEKETLKNELIKMIKRL